MAIPTVNLNVDPRGYAGSIVSGLTTPSAPPGINVAPADLITGGKSPLFDLLKAQALLRQQIAKEQLAQMKLQRREMQRELAQPFGMTSAQRNAMQMRPGPMAPNQVDPTNYSLLRQYLNAGGRGMVPIGMSDPRATEAWLQWMGPDNVARGLMQTGQLMSMGRPSGVEMTPLGQAQTDYFQSQMPTYRRPVNTGPAGPTPSQTVRASQFGLKKGTVPDSYAEGTLPKGATDLLDKILEASARAAKKAEDYNIYSQNWYPTWPREGADYARQAKAWREANRRLNQKFIDLTQEAGSSPWRARAKNFFKGTAHSVDAFLEPLFGLYQNDPEGKAALQSIGILPPEQKTYRKGSLPGTVPKTGQYKLHKNEIVISPEQAAPGGELDQSLMDYLVYDKMRKGLAGGPRPGQTSYQTGSIPPDSSPAFWQNYMEQLRAQEAQRLRELPVPVRPETGFTMPGRRLSAGWGTQPFGDMAETIRGGGELFPPTSALPSGYIPPQLPANVPAGSGELTPAGLGRRMGGGSTGPSPVIRGTKEVKQLTAGESMLMRRPSSELVEMAVKNGVARREAESILKRGGKAALVGALIGLAAYGVSQLLGGDEEPAPVAPPSPAGPEAGSTVGAMFPGRSLDEIAGFTEGPQPATGPWPSSQVPTSPDSYPSLGGASAEANIPDWLRRQPVPETVAGGDFLTSPDYAPPQGTPHDIYWPAIEQSPEDRYQGDLADAQKRIAEWKAGGRQGPLDLGTISGEGRAPLVRGDENKPPDERYFAPEEPAWRQAQHQKTMATLNRMKADRILNFLSQEGSNLPRDQQQAMMQQVQFLQRINEMSEAQQERRQQWREKQTMALQDAWSEFQKKALAAQVEQDEQKRREANEARYKLEERMYELQDKIGETEDEETKVYFIKQLAPVMARLSPDGGSAEEMAAYLAEQAGIDPRRLMR